MKLQGRIWILNIVMFVVPILIALVLLLSYFWGLKLLSNAGFYYRIETERTLKVVTRVLEPLTFYGLENRDAQYIVDYSYGLFDPKEVYIEVLDKGRVIYRYGDPGIYNSSAIVGLLDVNPELVGIMYQSNETNVYEGRRRTDNHNYVYIFSAKESIGGNNDLLESVSVYIMIVALLVLLLSFYLLNSFVTKFLMIHVKSMTKSLETANKSLETANESLESAYISLEKANHQIEIEQEQQKELLAGISHDIRTPLTAIKAYAEGVRDGIAPTDEQRSRYMEIILKRANDLESMLEELFLITTAEYKEESRPKQKIDLGRFVQVFCEENAPHYKTRGIEIEVNAEKDAFIKVNPQLLQRVIQNVLNNSAKYKTADIGHCVIDVARKNDRIVCMLSDDGPGVPPESLERLMRPFYRVDPSRTNSQKGSGLGLSIIRRIMDVSDGDVAIENVKPHGLRIILEFPMGKVD